MTKTSGRTTEVLWARFRFSVIGSLLSAPPPRGELKQAIQALAKKVWTHPVTGRNVQYAVTTIERWYYTARNEPDDPVRVLQRAVRKDCGKVFLGSKLAEHLREQYHQHPQWNYQHHYDNLVSAVEADPSLGPLRSYSTVKRYMQVNGLVRIRRPEFEDPEIAQLKLRAWLLDIILSKATPENVRNKLEIENIDHITEVARNGAMALRKRALAILARSKGASERVVAECLNMHPNSVGRVLSEFRRSNDPFQVLKRRPRRRNDDERRRRTNALIEILHHKPSAYGINRSNWTRGAIADAYEKQYGMRISASTVGRHFKEAGYTRKKSLHLGLSWVDHGGSADATPLHCVASLAGTP